MPPTKPPAAILADKPIGTFRDAQGREVQIKPTPEFLQWLNSVIRSLNSAT